MIALGRGDARTHRDAIVVIASTPNPRAGPKRNGFPVITVITNWVGTDLVITRGVAICYNAMKAAVCRLCKRAHWGPCDFGSGDVLEGTSGDVKVEPVSSTPLRTGRDYELRPRVKPEITDLDHLRGLSADDFQIIYNAVMAEKMRRRRKAKREGE